MKYSKFLIVIITMCFLAGCNRESNRKIRLEAKSGLGLLPEKVATIQVAASKKKTVAVMCFHNDTQKQNLEWLEQGIVEMLVTDLAQSRQLNILPSVNVSEAFKVLGLDEERANEPDIGVQVSQKLRAEVFICGRYYNKKDSLVIELDLRDGKNGELINRKTVAGAGLENVFTMMDNMAKNLKNDLQIQFRDIREVDQNIADFMTNSVEAYEAYSKGVEIVNKLYYRDAIPYFEKAIEIDSTFASAYLHLAKLHFHMKDHDTAFRLLSKAVGFSDNAPIKETLNILSLEAMTRGDFIKAIEINKKITDMFPEDDEAQYNLGTLYYSFSLFEQSVARLEAAVALNPQNKLAHNQLAYVYAHIGKFDLALQTIEKYVELAPDEPNPYDSKGEILQRAGRIDDAIEQYKKALQIEHKFEPSITHMLVAYLDKGENKNAAKLGKRLLKIAKNDHSRFWAHLYNALVEVANENSDKAKDYVAKAHELNLNQMESISFFELLEPNSKENIQRLDRLIEKKKRDWNNDPSVYLDLFAIVNCCLYHQHNLESATELLNKTIENDPGPNYTHNSYAFKQIIEMYSGNVNPKTNRELLDYSSKDPYFPVRKISWEYYWRHYFGAVQNSYPKLEGIIENLNNLKNYSIQQKNLQFEIEANYASAFIYQMEGAQQIADSFFVSTGTPPENAWYISRSYKRTKGFHQAFYPEMLEMDSIILEPAQEHAWSNQSDGLVDGYINLKKMTGSQFNSTIYAKVPIFSSKARTIQMRFGVNKPIKVWLNNEQIFIKNMFYQRAVLDDYVFSTRLRSGVNWLLVKLSGLAGEYGFYFRATDETGHGVPGVFFEDNPSV